jgi:pectin methylesterase-like acyl-CoA thioesterase
VSSRVVPVVGLAFALCSGAIAQTLTVPIDSKSVTADGRPVTVSGQVTVTIGPAPVPVALYGPRDPVGCDVPLNADETVALARRVVVQGFTAQAVQSACDAAKAQGVPVVYLPAGIYTLSTYVNVPGGLALLGSGSSTSAEAVHALCVAALHPRR